MVCGGSTELLPLGTAAGIIANNNAREQPFSSARRLVKVDFS